MWGTGLYLTGKIKILPVAYRFSAQGQNVLFLKLQLYLVSLRAPHLQFQGHFQAYILG